MAKKRNAKAKATTELDRAPSLPVEIGRIAKILAIYVLKDIEEGKKAGVLAAFGYSAREIGGLLGKTEAAAQKAIQRSRS